MKGRIQTVSLITLCLLQSLVAAPLRADTTEFFNDGSLILVAADAALEAPVPIYHNGTLIGGHNHKLVEAFDQVPGTGSFPLVFVDMHANTFLRNTYQKTDGSGAALGTSVVGSASFRTDAGLQYIPGVTRGDVFTNGFFGRYYSQIQGAFGTQASITTTRTFPDPTIGNTTVGLSIDFTADQNIDLATGFVTGNDRFRMMTVSSMFSSPTVYDADILRYEDSDGVIQTRQLSGSTVRGTYVLPVADEVGDWIELIKSPGSTWFSDSPTIRIDLTDKGGMRLGVQGFLAGTTDPNDDSLSVWLEWLDAPDTISTGTSLGIEVDVVASGDPDRPVIIGDINADGYVGIEDLNTVLANWNQAVLSGFYTVGDPTADGFVGIEDLNTVLSNWNAGTSPANQAGSPIPTPSTGLLLAGGGCLGPPAAPTSDHFTKLIHNLESQVPVPNRAICQLRPSSAILPGSPDPVHMRLGQAEYPEAMNARSLTWPRKRSPHSSRSRPPVARPRPHRRSAPRWVLMA